MRITDMVHCATIVGARPQFVKAAVLSRCIRAIDGVKESLIHTGQHYDEQMSQRFFDELDIPKPAYHLGISGGSHGQMTGRMLEGIEQTLTEIRPDWVVVYGDTNSTLAGALAAAKLGIPVAHIEAGLRSFDRHMPEEVNRVLVDHCSQMHLAPTSTAAENLHREGVPDSQVHQVGDVMFDAARFYAQRAEQASRILSTLDLSPKSYYLATVHRAANTSDRKALEAIVAALITLHQQCRVVWPLHPRTKQALIDFGLWDRVSKSGMLCDPLGYLDMTELERKAKLILTDSGGVQREAFFHGIPCVTLRPRSEWVELEALGVNRCTTLEHDAIQTAAEAALSAAPDWSARPYGDGDAGSKIVSLLAGSAHG